MTWSGACVNKKAHGVGVARMLAGASVQGIWYGEVKHGTLHAGVIEDVSGFEAGGFLNGKWQESQNSEQERIAIAHARKAVEALIKQFEKSSNQKSAAYYRGRLGFIEAMTQGE